MPKLIDEMSENEKKFLLGLIEDGSKTDTEIAAEQEMSKSTANRIRRSFEDSGVIAEYLPIIRLDSVGVEVFATLTMEFREPVDVDEIASLPNVIFMGETDDFARSYVIFAGFETFDAYNSFIEEFKAEYRDRVSSFDNHLIAPGNIIKEDFTQIVKHNLQTALRDADED